MVHVTVPPQDAFDVFTQETDLWWRRGPKYRVAGRRVGTLQFEARAGGRLFESFDGASGPQLFEVGRIQTWEPPRLLVFQWRGGNFAPGEETEVEVAFEPTEDGTLVTVVHRGFASLRPDHPVRHGQPPADFVRELGLWWGELLTSLREHAKGRLAS